ncbi:MAG: type I methionyl aminopeptidase [Caldimonas sp.]
MRRTAAPVPRSAAATRGDRRRGATARCRSRPSGRTGRRWPRRGRPRRARVRARRRRDTPARRCRLRSGRDAWAGSSSRGAFGGPENRWRQGPGAPEQPRWKPAILERRCDNSPMTISIKNDIGAAGMRVAGRLASEVLDMLTPHVQPGISTEALDKLAHDYIVGEQDAIPAPLNYAPPGYSPYPKSICTSINHQVCHGIPNDRPLKNGDIVNIDVTVIKDGWHGDTSRMFIVGEGSIAAKRLVQLTYDAMWKGIVKVKPGVRLGDIGFAIQTFTEGNGFSVVREFCGHGIGTRFHEDPQVLHYGKPGTLDELKVGMTFTIEPMINAGKREIREAGDGWTIVTRDRSLSAQWEHTILVTDTGYEVMTLSAGSPPPPAFVAA